MGLSHSIAFSIISIAMIISYIVIAGGVFRMTQLSIPYSNMQSVYDLCSVLNIELIQPSTIAVNISNNGSTSWWDYQRTYAIADIIYSNGTNSSKHYPVSDLQRAIYGDIFNPGVVDPGEILSINITTDISRATHVRIVFITQHGSRCTSYL